MSINHGSAGELTHKDTRRVIVASSLGTIFEWYDFFIYGTLAGLFGKLFFPTASPTAGLLLALATFGVGFAVRPVGAVVFGVLGDRLGRKYTFIVTIALMGAATAGIGFLPTFESIGILAPILLVSLRALQGFALGGEYGGASIYVAEHAPPRRRGYFTSFIQAGVPAGLLLSLTVSMGANWLSGEEHWAVWGWRIPFIFSLLLLGISLWIRLKLAESPVFKAMKDAGKTAANPLKESIDSWPKIRRMLVALVVAAGQAVGGNTALFQGMYFLQNSLHVAPSVARLAALIATFCAIGLYILSGWLSDRVGRKRLIVIGFALTTLLLFPIFHFLARQGNPTLSGAMNRNPVVVTGSDCYFNPFATKGQVTDCGKLLDMLSKNGVAYAKVDGVAGTAPSVTIGGEIVDTSDPRALTARLKRAGFNLDTVTPPPLEIALIALSLIALYVLAAMTFGPLAATLVELFPARVRYTSLSIPYHFANGYAGGFLTFISQYIVAKTGNPFAGLWYPVSIVALALVVSIFFLPETLGTDPEPDQAG